MDEEAECEGRRWVKCGRRSGGRESAVGVYNETADEVEVRVDAMLLGQLYARHANLDCNERDARMKPARVSRTERIST